MHNRQGRKADTAIAKKHSKKDKDNEKVDITGAEFILRAVLQ